MRATVVVPSRDRPGSLARCLDALGEQQTEEPFDVVVVDDASVDGDVVRSAVAGRARIVVGEGRGPAAARNLGAGSTDAEVVLLTDDDCRPSPRWVQSLLDRVRAGADVVAGPTIVPAGAGAPARAAQVVTNHLVHASLAGGVVGFAPTSNLAVRSSVLAGLPFDEAYPLAAGEDRDWCDRLAAGGGAIAYEPAAVVDHHPDLPLAGFWRQQVRYGRGAHRFRSSGDRGRSPARFYVDLLRSGLRDGVAVGGLVVAAQAATAVGLVAEARAARRA